MLILKHPNKLKKETLNTLNYIIRIFAESSYFLTELYSKNVFLCMIKCKYMFQVLNPIVLSHPHLGQIYKRIILTVFQLIQ